MHPLARARGQPPAPCSAPDRLLVSVPLSLTVPPNQRYFSQFLNLSLRHGTKVWVDSKAIIKVLGSTMDFVEDDLRSEFVFENPNAKGACGCGESWHT